MPMIKKKRASISARPLQLSLSLRGMFARSYLLTTAAYRSNVGHRQMTVLVWIIFRLVLCSLLGVVHLLMVNRPSDSYRLPHIITQVRPITFQFPSRAVIRHQLVIASLQNSFTSAFRMTSGQTPTVR